MAAIQLLAGAGSALALIAAKLTIFTDMPDMFLMLCLILIIGFAAMSLK